MKVSLIKRFRKDLDQLDGSSEADGQRRRERAATIQASVNAPMFLAAIDKDLTELDTIPGAYVEDDAIGVGLAEADFSFDGFGAAGYFRIESELRLPEVLAARREALQAAQADMFPSLGHFRVSYAQEAADTRPKVALLEKHRATLESLPTTDGTVFDWGVRHVEAGLRIEALLAERALAAGASDIDRRRIVELRSHLVSLINAFRQALAHEAILRPEVPANAVAMVFSLLDAPT